MDVPCRLTLATTDADLAGVAKVWRDIYGVEDFDPESPTERLFYLGRVGDEPAFAAAVEVYDYLVRGVTLKAAAIGGVAVLGQFRGTGVGTSAMWALDQALRGSAFALGCLYAFRDPFYRRVGYETCGWRWKIRCDAAQMPKWRVGLPVRQLSPDDAPQLNACYEAFIAGFNGSARRGVGEWKRRLGRKPPVIYALGDPVEAYFWANLNGFWDDLEIGEFAWSTPLGYESALGLMRGMAINKKGVSWMEPVSSPFLAKGMDSSVTAEVSRWSMFRLIDPEGVLRRMEARFRDGLTLEVSGFDLRDQILRIDLAGGGPAVGLSIQALTQGVMGMPSFDELDRFGSLSGDRVGIDLLIDAFPAQPVTCMEFF